MIWLLFVLSIITRAEESKPKFHYGDKVEVHSSAWVKPCFDDSFINVCGRVGIVNKLYSPEECATDGCYGVIFYFDKLEPIQQRFNEVHLRKVK